jgi:hypothetical protein
MMQEDKVIHKISEKQVSALWKKQFGEQEEKDLKKTKLILLLISVYCLIWACCFAFHSLNNNQEGIMSNIFSGIFGLLFGFCTVLMILFVYAIYYEIRYGVTYGSM